ncbi:hypothetical protein U1Q18_015928 [Sarracenia purpurea var. burkii]
MMMVKRSLASVAVALICFLYFNASTETQIRSVLNQWCIVKPSTPAAILDGIIQFCCTQSRVDCGVIQPGGICYDPATNKVSDASVVMNLYYKVAGKSDFNCYFNGSGLILTQDPCEYDTFFYILLLLLSSFSKI